MFAIYINIFYTGRKNAQKDNISVGHGCTYAKSMHDKSYCNSSPCTVYFRHKQY